MLVPDPGGRGMEEALLGRVFPRELPAASQAGHEHGVRLRLPACSS